MKIWGLCFSGSVCLPPIKLCKCLPRSLTQKLIYLNIFCSKKLQSFTIFFHAINLLLFWRLKASGYCDQRISLWCLKSENVCFSFLKHVGCVFLSFHPSHKVCYCRTKSLMFFTPPLKRFETFFIISFIEAWKHYQFIWNIIWGEHHSMRLVSPLIAAQYQLVPACFQAAMLINWFRKINIISTNIVRGWWGVQCSILLVRPLIAAQ